MSSGPPPGIDLNADIKASAIGPVIALAILATAAVGLRIMAKVASRTKLEIDDYFIFAALIAAYGTGAISICACFKGMGKHIWNPDVDVGAIVKLLWAYEFMYGTVIPLIKLSIIFFYYRIFEVPMFRKILYVVVFLVVGWWIAIFVVSWVQCKPYSYFWNQYVDPTAQGSCINIGAFFIGNGVASVVTDFLILLTPIPMVWSLHMPVEKRLSILGIFALGGFVCVAGVVRITVLKKMLASADLSWNMSQGFVWSSIEPNIGIVCACLPTLYPLFRQWLPRLFPGGSVTPSSQRYGTGPSKLRSQNSDFYALNDRKIKLVNKSDDEMGLTNEFRGGQRATPNHDDSGDDGGLAGHHMNIMVKRDVVLTESAVL